MPSKKPDENKRVRAVTEEIPINDTPQTPKQPELVEPVKIETPKVESAPNLVAVEETENISPEMPGQKKKGVFGKFLLITLISAGLVVALAGGVYVYLNGVNQNTTDILEATPEPAPLATPEPTASQTPVPKESLSIYKVSVLNGSGKIGVAGVVKGLLEKGGFEVGSTGNANNFDFTDTVISTKDSVPTGVVDTAKILLSNDYSVKIGEPLLATSPNDIVVTVGSK
jgi:hypothetical protein